MSEPPLPVRSPLRPRPPAKTRSSTPEPSALVVPMPTTTRREHALQELLASEQAYISDLALVRQVHIPLALGQPITLDSTLLTSTVEAPMSPEDAKLIFSNISDVADFANRFSADLAAAVAADTIGALFLDNIPAMEKPYKVYIAKHETAANHFHALPASPALTAYHTQTRTIASSMSHAWDLHSMLIKPVQRLLKYPLLLAAIYDETPATHPDKDNLRLAKDAVQSLAHRVNEERRRAEIVKDVLKRTNKDLLVRIKNIKPVPPPDSDESLRISHFHAHLLRAQAFANQFAQNVLQWSQSVTACATELNVFALSFANVIGLSPDVQSDSFDAFLTVLSDKLIPQTTTLSQQIADLLLAPLAQLLETINNPLHLLETLQTTLLPLHTHLIHMPLSVKNRPPPELIKASAEYLALRGKLAEELPVFLRMSERIFTGCITRLARLQKEHWEQTSKTWSDLWKLLRVEGEDLETGNTVNVWRGRWEEVDVILSQLQVVRPSVSPPTPVRSTSSRTSASSSSLSNTPTAVNVSSVLSTLAPSRSSTAPLPPKSPSTSIPPRTKGRTLSTEFEYDFGYDYMAVAQNPLAALTSSSPTTKKVSKKSKRPATSSGLSPSGDMPSRKLSFRRKVSDPALREKKEKKKEAGLYLVESVYAFEAPVDPRSPPGKPTTYVYDSYPFLTLKGSGEVYEVVREAGHPREHISRGLMLHVDDRASEEPDSLLLVRRTRSKSTDVGWALASYLQPLDTS